jgi:transcriptional regulator with XRE-family HTH domain
MNEDQRIGNNLQLLRKKLGFTQEEIAEFLGITRVELSYYETGARSVPTTVITPMANLYGVDEFDLYAEKFEVSQVNLALAFRGDSVRTSDLVQLAAFKKIVRNYLQMKSLLADESTCC